MQVVWFAAALFAFLVVLLNALQYALRAWWVRSMEGCERDERLGLIDAAWAFIAECVATALVMALFPIGWLSPRCARSTGQRGPVILVHGWGGNRGAWWLLRHRLLRDGWSPVCCLDYSSWTADIEGAARQLHACVQRVAMPDQRATLVGHGLGGLVLRVYVRRHHMPQIRRIVTVGTAHQGTALASYGPLRKTLAPDAPVMTKLNAVDHLPRQFDVIAIYSTFDATIVPPANARYPGAFNIQLSNIGHNALLFSAKVYRLIAENLAAPFA